MSLTTDLKAYALDLGFDLVATTSADPFPEAERAMLDRIDRGLLRGLDWFSPRRAHVSANPRDHLATARSIVSLGMSYLSTEPPGAPIRPVDRTLGPPDLRGVVARYAWGEDYHRILGDRLTLLATWLRDRGGARHPARTFVDHGWMADRAVAQRSGLGWLGKNTNILTRTHGSWVLLGEVLTDVELELDEPLRATCGACTRCIEGCPTGCIVAPGVLDNARCISFLTIELRGWMPHDLRSLVGEMVFGCDVCQEVCPVNRKARPGDHPELAPSRGIGPAPELVPLLRLDDAEFRARFRGTPITRAKRRGLARNAAVALGNRGDPAAIPALIAALGDADPLVRGHVAWALGRIGGGAASAALESARRREADRDVITEIELALEEAVK